VTFYDGIHPIGSAPVSGGKATLTISTLAVGNHLIYAAYNGDDHYMGSSSTPISQMVLTAAPAPQPSRKVAVRAPVKKKVPAPPPNHPIKVVVKHPVKVVVKPKATPIRHAPVKPAASHKPR
jgi:hypothetical protein